MPKPSRHSSFLEIFNLSRTVLVCAAFYAKQRHFMIVPQHIVSRASPSAQNTHRRQTSDARKEGVNVEKNAQNKSVRAKSTPIGIYITMSNTAHTSTTMGNARTDANLEGALKGQL